MSERFFCESLVTGSTYLLSGAEANHLAKVMRAQPGDQVLLFDGSGREFKARVTEMRGKSVALHIMEVCPVQRELPFELILAVALPKGERQRFLIEKAVELGATQLVPLIAERSVAKPNENALERLRRTVVEASKQCGRNCLMEIAAAKTWQKFVESHADLLTYCADPNAENRWSLIEPQVGGRYAIAIGPEGGWSETELDLAKSHHVRLVSLGPRILRVETAVLAVASWFSLQG